MKRRIGFFMVSMVLIALVAFNLCIYADSKTTTINFWFPGSDETNDNYFLDAAKEFEKANPKIKVVTTVLPSAVADIETKLNAAILSGTFPDVMSTFLNLIGSRGPKGSFYPLDSFINKWADKKDIYESTLDIGKYKNKTIGMGFYPNPKVLVYRKDFYKEAGLNPEKPPVTWEELADYAVKTTKKDSNGNVIRAGFDIPASKPAVFMRIFMRQNGVEVINEKKDAPCFTDKKAVEALEYLVKLKNNNVSIPFNFQKYDQFPFVSGKSAMSFLEPSQIVGLINENPQMKEKLGFVPVMGKNKKSAFCGYRLFTIGNNSKYKKESWEFIKFMMSKEQMLKRAKELSMPVVRESLEEQYIGLNPGLNRAIVEYNRLGKGAESVSWVNIGLKHLELAYEEAYNNKKTAAQALKDAQNNCLNDLKMIK